MSNPVFSKEDIDKIAACLECTDISDLKDHYRLKIVNTEDKRHISLEIYPELALSDGATGSLVVVYTHNCHLQIHRCSGYVVSTDLGEVTFISESGESIAGLVIERGAACSLYSNVDRELISDDFTQFGVEVMLSGVALSLAEDILKENPSD